MRRTKTALFGSLLLGLATAVWAAAPTPTAVPAPLAPAVATPASPAADLFAPAPQSSLTLTCSGPPTTVCTSCLYFGVKSAYQCTTYCANGVLHRSCTTCGEGCNN